jgi:hypothetical protein
VHDVSRSADFVINSAKIFQPITRFSCLAVFQQGCALSGGAVPHG